MTEKEWGIVISLFLGGLGVYGVMFWRLWSYVVNKKNGVSKIDFDEHVKDFKHHKDGVQYKENCLQVQKFFNEKIDNTRELLDQKIDTSTKQICTEIKALSK